MPGLITHNIVANQIIDRISTDNKAAFLLGSLGPDMCYFHRAMPWQKGPTRAYGKKIHYMQPNALFNCMNELLLINNDPAIKSFVEGFMCHYALDSTAHPFVYWSIPKYKSYKSVKYNDGFIHNFIEYKLDALILMERSGKKVKDIDFGSVIPTDRKAVDAAAYVMSYVINKLFSDNTVTQKTFIQAYADLSYNTHLLQNSSKFTKGAISFFEKLLHIGPILSPLFWGDPDYSYDYMNLSHCYWYNLNEPETMLNYSYLTLADVAVDYTCELVTKLRNALDRGVTAEYSLCKLFVNGKRIEGYK